VLDAEAGQGAANLRAPVTVHGLPGFRGVEGPPGAIGVQGLGQAVRLQDRSTRPPLVIRTR